MNSNYHVNDQTDKNSKRKILLVDDDIAVLQSLQLTLELYNYEVYLVENGIEAIQIVNLNPDKYPIILLDLMLPDISGYEVLIALKNIIKKHNISVIVHSGIGNDHEKIKAKNLGAKEFISKPHKIKELLKIIKAVRHEKN